jgi:hypothetical protein
MIKCFLTIVIQVMIIYLRFDEAIKDQTPIENGTPELNCVKLACAFFMHLQLYPEIEISLGMIRFGVYNSERFKSGPFFPMVLCIVKIFGAVVAEVGSAYLLVQAPTVKLTLAFFLGMSVVANIDNIMALTVTDVNIGLEMEKETI